MSIEWNDKDFDKWQKLRNKYREAKKENNYKKVISLCETIIDLDKRAKFICIMTPLFLKDIANAYYKLGEMSKSLKYYELALDSFVKFRAENKLNKPTDWLNDIDKIQKKIEMLKNKLTIF
ncbi:MAG: hypothetical protein CVT49_15350 [candidate division Zixibacteria bacterium HGW-Zixibacteria-1]|nr:MAG: hypothetical protein CVT49_15350 [candidate division Zixibacteria bacterium HGW-Zixibacteria-1]